MAHERKDLAGLRVHGHDSTSAFPKCLLGRYLHVEVNGEIEVLSGFRVNDPKILHLQSRGVDLDHPSARDPPQERIIGFFEPCLARQDAEVGLFSLQLFLRYFPDITELV